MILARSILPLASSRVTMSVLERDEAGKDVQQAEKDQRKFAHDFTWNALMTSATPAISIIMPTTNTLATVAMTTL